MRAKPRADLHTLTTLVPHRFSLTLSGLALSAIALSGLSFAQLSPLPETPAPFPSPFTTPTPLPESRAVSTIAPGLTLLRVQTNTPRGPLRYFLVRADRRKFRLDLQIPDKNDALKKRSVRALAAQFKAPVVINGGFFAYGGAAVGAVKVGNVWQRLPWKSRTALGWNDVRGAQIGNLSGGARLTLKTKAGGFAGFNAALNGFTFPGDRIPIVDGFSILTPMFAPKYTLKTGEVCAVVLDGQIQAPLTSGVIEIPRAGFLLVARGSTPIKTLGESERASWKFSGSKSWDKWPHILGAGPRLVQKGAVKTTEFEEEFRPDVLARGPRSAVGLAKNGDWLFLVADGRQVTSVGLSLPETAELFVSLGAVEAMNLDGGSSTQLAVLGQLVNRPSAFDPVDPTKAREVMVSNALAFMPRR